MTNLGIVSRIRRAFGGEVKSEAKESPTFADTPPGIVVNASLGANAPTIGRPEDNDVVQACLAANARHTAKARARVIRTGTKGLIPDDRNARLERLLNQNPNPQQNGYGFLFDVRALCDRHGMALIYVDRGLRDEPIGFYPIRYDGVYALVNPEDRRFVRGFQVYWGGREFRFPLRDLIVLYKGLKRDGFYGFGNDAIYHSLGMTATIDTGTKNAVTLSSSLRGVLKFTKGMLNPEDSKKMRDAFVKDYLGSGTGGGIGALDASYEFAPLDLKPHAVEHEILEIYEKRIMRFFGVNDAILMGNYSETQWTSYYEATIEPFLIGLSQAMTNACFTPTERAYHNEVIYESSRLLYASVSSKMQLSALVDRGLLTTNEFREMFALPPVDGGNKMVIRKEYTERDNLDGTSSGPAEKEVTDDENDQN